MTRIFCKTQIKKSSKNIGKIHLVKYRGQSIPHIEFEIEERHRNKGIMSKELPKYLKKIKDLGQNRLLAIVKQDNLASMKLLEKNSFIKFATFETTFAYILAMDLMHEIKKFQREVLRNLTS